MAMSTRRRTTIQRGLFHNYMFVARTRISGLQYSALRFIHARSLAER